MSRCQRGYLGKIMLFVRPGMETDLKKIDGLAGSTLIYSLWDGYREKPSTRRFLQAMEEIGVTIKTLHTSGHADLPALQRMANTLQPKKIIPIHTFHPEEYAKVFSQPIALAEDGHYAL